MTDEQIHNIYLHMSGKAEGLAEAQGHADFPVLFARAILEYNRMERKLVGLTAEEVSAIWDSMGTWNSTSAQHFYNAIWKAIKEKNSA